MEGRQRLRERIERLQVEGEGRWKGGRKEEGGGGRGERKGEKAKRKRRKTVKYFPENYQLRLQRHTVADLPEPNPALGQDLSGEKWSISAEDEEHTNTVQSQLTSNRPKHS